METGRWTRTKRADLNVRSFESEEAKFEYIMYDTTNSAQKLLPSAIGGRIKM